MLLLNKHWHVMLTSKVYTQNLRALIVDEAHTKKMVSSQNQYTCIHTEMLYRLFSIRLIKKMCRKVINLFIVGVIHSRKYYNALVKFVA